MESLLISSLTKVSTSNSVLYIAIFSIIAIALGIIVNKQEKNK